MAKQPVIPWDYYQRMRNNERSEPDDPVTAAISMGRANRVQRTIMEAPDSPDDAARVTRVARETGEPPAMVQGRLGDFERALGSKRFADVVARYAPLAEFFDKNPRAAVAAQDDHTALDALGRIGEFFAGAPDALKAGTTSLAASLNDIYQTIDEVILPIAQPGRARERLDAYDRTGAAYRQRADRERPQSDSLVVQSSFQAVESLPTAGVSTVVGMVTGSPAAAAAMMGTVTGVPAYREALKAGKGTPTAIRYGIEQGGTEALTEMIPASRLLEAITKRTPVGKAIVRSLAAEIPGEQVATLVQDFSTWATMNPERPFAEYLAARPEAALRTAIATVVGTSMQVGVTTSVARAAQELGTRAERASRARRDSEALKQYESAALSSNFRKRDADGYNEMVGNVAQRAGHEFAFIPGARDYLEHSVVAGEYL